MDAIIICICGFEHKDTLNMLIKTNTLNRKQYYCKECGRILNFRRTLTPTEFKKIYNVSDNNIERKIDKNNI